MSYKFNPFTGNLDQVIVGGATWKDPVANAAALPTTGNSDGDARVTLDTDEIWVWDDASARWENQQIQTTTGIGATANSQGYSISENTGTPSLRTNELVLEPASASFPGIVTTSAQSLAGNKTFSNDVIVTGNLTVNGTTTTLNTATLDVTDTNITVNKGGNDISAEGAGLTVERATTNGSFVYEDALTSKFKLGAIGSEVEVADISSNQALSNKTINNTNTVTVKDTLFTLQDNVDTTKQAAFELSGIATSTTRTYTLPDANDTLVGKATTDILTNKSIDADTNTITNIDNNEIRAAAAIDATKIHDGSVTNTEFGYIGGLLSDAQTQIDGKASTQLDNLGTTAINADLIPATTSRYLGSITKPWVTLYSTSLILYTSGSRRGSINTTLVTPSGATPVVGLTGSNNLYSSGVITSNTTNTANDTGSVYIESGNQNGVSGGHNSGKIQLKTGISITGVRGAIILDSGSISINSDDTSINVNSNNITSLADPTNNQDAATKKYVDDNTTFVTGDLDETSFTIANNQSTAANVTGLAFANATNRSAEIQYSIIISATTSLYESGVIRLVQKGASWDLSQSTNGDVSQVSFSVTSAGQVQYTSANYAGYTAATMKFRATTTSV